MNATLTAETQLATAISRALGHNRTHTIAPDENAACLTLWSIRELQDAYDRIGGTVTARTVTRLYSGGVTAPCIEIVLTADLDGIGPVALNTDWDPADEAYGLGLSVIQALGAATV